MISNFRMEAGLYVALKVEQKFSFFLFTNQ